MDPNGAAKLGVIVLGSAAVAAVVTGGTAWLVANHHGDVAIGAVYAVVLTFAVLWRRYEQRKLNRIRRLEHWRHM